MPPEPTAEPVATPRWLVLGVAKLLGKGPSNEIYSCYHASRLVHEAADAEAWAGWRASVADLLIEAQTKNGDAAGSWPMQGQLRILGQPLAYSEIGGPIVKTSLAALTLAEPLERTEIRPRRAAQERKNEKD